MVSSVVKGIDVLQGALEQKDLHVILIGASKRGWTTYLTAAVDKRVAAIVPTVFEMVSMEQQVALARERYGKDSEKIRPYTALGLTDSLKEPRLQQLISWIDPISYFPEYTMPKLVLLGANDPYWVVDSVRKYWDKLPEPKLLRILPNVGHGVLGEDAASEAIASFVTLIMNNKPLPKASWSFSDPANGIALVRGQGDFQIARCSIWKAASESTDFRTALFSQSGCEVSQDKKSFKATVPVSGAENIALFADLEAERSSGDSKMVLSSESKVYLNQR
jgi:PhoPQ-activated pathogenicity-related protein